EKAGHRVLRRIHPGDPKAEEAGADLQARLRVASAARGVLRHGHAHLLREERRESSHVCSRVNLEVIRDPIPRKILEKKREVNPEPEVAGGPEDFPPNRDGESAHHGIQVFSFSCSSRGRVFLSRISSSYPTARTSGPSGVWR